MLWSGGVVLPPSLPHPERGLERGQEGRFGEGLEEAFDGSFGQQAGSNRVIRTRGDEHDRYLLSECCQFALQVRSGHPRHLHVENQTMRSTDRIRGEKFLGRREGGRSESKLA